MASQIVELTGDEAKLLRSLDRIIQKEREHERKLASVGDAGDQAGRRIGQGMDSASKATSGHVESIRKHLERIPVIGGKAADALFGKIDSGNRKSKDSFRGLKSSASDQLQAMVAGYVGLQEAVQKFIELNEKAIERSKKAFGTLQGTEEGDRRLLQVSATPAEFTQRRARADQLAASYGIDRGDARNLVFQGVSEGFTDALEFIGSRSQVIAPESQAIVAGQVPGLFKSSGQEITPQQAINATLAGATASRLDFEDLARVVPGAAEGAAQLGSSPSETIASLSVLASRFKSPETAADRIKAFGTKASLDPRLSGSSGILDAVEQLQGFTEEDRKSFLGDSQELNVAFSFLSEELATIRGRQTEIESAISATGTEQSPTALRVAAANADPKLRTLLQERKARITEEITVEDRRAVDVGQRETRRAKASAAAERDGVSERRIAAGELLGEGVERLTGKADDGTAIRAVSGSSLENLFRDVSFAGRRGDSDATAAGLLVSKLIRRRQENPDAIVSPDDASEFIRGTSGRFVSPAFIDEGFRKSLTNAVLSESENAPGFARTASISFLNGFDNITGGNLENSLLLNPAANSAAAQGSSAADRLVAVLERNNELLERAAKASEQTANNTAAGTDEPVDYGAIQRGREE